ncbi:MAG TPA: ATP-dependent DNA helicase RecG [Candidatus Limnocylindrales bacterium]|nr:ATP-dependent DNA helicase RecG [Candidatus Limnocylindrales bacterium]
MKPAVQSSENKPVAAHPQLSVRDCLRALSTSVQFLKGVGPKRAAQLEAAGLATVEDVLYHLPFRYEDRRQLKKINQAAIGQEESFAGQLVMLQNRFNARRRRQMLSAVLRDETGTLDLMWYRAPSYLAKGLAQGQNLLVHGKVEQGTQGRLRIVHPEFEVLDDGEESDPTRVARILPVYLRPGGIPLSFMRKLATQALQQYRYSLPPGLPRTVASRMQLASIPEALSQLHGPSIDTSVSALNEANSPAHRSVIFDELFYLQLGLGLRKHSRAQSKAQQVNIAGGRLVTRMLELLPFKLTNAQQRVFGEIAADMAGAQPMQRLVQGDVGSGKTMVAWLASLRVIEQGYQALWMAPTEILAEQHFRGLSRYAESLGVTVAILTAATPAKARKELLARIESGEIQFVVGTHAVIQEDVHAPCMGLGVIDEQHRFGVAQRLSLRRLVAGKESLSSVTHEPHMLLMSATPIPRSLAIVLYGDMEVSFVDEMPPGRTPVETRVFTERERKQVYSIVLEQLRQGHQAFVVLPLVEPSEQLEQVKDATQMAEKMRETLFKDFGVGLVHGRMKVEERDQTMRAFRDGKLGILVATTVIEVGIDIANATVMVIEHAERFGLSQLHQLRGRVGRGQAPGYCLLVNRGTASAVAVERLRVMAKEKDGFKIAEADLKLRGPGELLGTRQSGLADFRLASLTRDTQLLIAARQEALAWLEKDPQLKMKDSAGMRDILKHRWGKRLQLGSVG